MHENNEELYFAVSAVHMHGSLLLLCNL